MIAPCSHRAQRIPSEPLGNLCRASKTAEGSRYRDTVIVHLVRRQQSGIPTEGTRGHGGSSGFSCMLRSNQSFPKIGFTFHLKSVTLQPVFYCQSKFTQAPHRQCKISSKIRRLIHVLSLAHRTELRYSYAMVFEVYALFPSYLQSGQGEGCRQMG